MILQRNLVVILIYFLSLNLGLSQVSQSKLPLDKNVRYGKLDNGVQYYILQTEDTSAKIQLQLSVNVGTHDETPDEYELAHFVEHMGMRSTQNFPRGLKNSLLALGLPRGSVGASTGATTDYKISIPNGDMVMLDVALLALSDCGGRMSFLPAEIEEERSAVFREGSNANSPSFVAIKEIDYRLSNEHKIFETSLREHMDNLSKASIESLVKFYSDWYHPIHETIFVVGNVDVSATEMTIKKHFGSLSNAGARIKDGSSYNPRSLLNNKNRLIIAQNGDRGSRIWLKVYRKKVSDITNDVCGTLKELEIKCKDELINKMIENRLKEGRNRKMFPETITIMREFLPPVKLDALVGSRFLNSSVDLKLAIQSICEEMFRAEKYGFSDLELQNAKTSLILSKKIDGFGNTFTNQRTMLALYSYHFLGRAFPSQVNEVVEKLISEMSLEKVNEVLKSWGDPSENIDITLLVPDERDPSLPNENQVINWVKESNKGRLSRYQPIVVKPLPPINQKSNPKSTIKEFPEIDVTRLTFHNGATVILKSLDSSPGQFELLGIKSSEAYCKYTLGVDGKLWRDVGRFAKVSSLSVSEIAAFKREHRVHVIPFPDNNRIQIVGVSQKNPENVFHLIYLYMAEASLDEKAFEDYCSSLPSKINRSGLEKVQLHVDSIVGLPLSNRVTWPCNKGSLKALSKLYKDSFGKAEGFTFVITGDFDKTEIIQLAEKYIGSLPGTGKEFISSRQKVQTGKSNFRPGEMITLIGDSINNVHVRILFEGREINGEKDRLTLLIANAALKQLFFTRLREKEKGVYGVENQFHLNKATQRFYLDVNFETAAEDVQRLIWATKDELQKLANESLQEDIFSTLISNIRPVLIEEIRNSKYFWTEYLLSRPGGRFDTSDELRGVEILESITAADVSNVIKRYLNVNSPMIFKVL